MGRVKSVALLTKQLEFATARQTYYSTPRPGKTTVDPNPKDTVVYECSTYKVGAASVKLKLQASKSSIDKFGGLDALGLVATDPTAVLAPKGFRPAKIKGTVGADTPTVRTSPVSGRRVVKYSAEASGDAKANFTAPIGGSTDVTQRTLFQSIVEAVAADFNAGEGGYGRLWFTPEYLPTSG
ncbi:hypothetical protein [Pseudanabaena sp. UWO310]|uniref:hypothetical protein n=1 Tax=Pseudanabaena sp. UWO310 TaxID=2480795 RepID=UPI00115BF3CB|nr:hypothetical protein [Pseudanabaena sp. UWO310]TYQ29968.1 hypothetical protein PseudUWO310_11145 [Pseudanabaena sp. UWO310]